MEWAFLTMAEEDEAKPPKYSFYEGTPYSFDPEKVGVYGTYTGYRQPASALALTTNPQTANQIKQLATQLSTGAKAVEMTLITPQLIEEIPKQHLDELRRLAKITGAKLSVHGPVRDATGYNSRAGVFDETERQGVEKQMVSNVEAASKIAPGSVVTFHASETLPEFVERVKEKGKEVVKSLGVVNTLTGQFRGVIRDEEKYFPREGEFKKGERIKFDPEKELKEYNKRIWLSELRDVTINASRGDDYLKAGLEHLPGGLKTYEGWKKGEIKPEDFRGKYTSEEEIVKDSLKHVEQGEIMIDAAFTELGGLFDTTYKTALGRDDKAALNKLNEFGNRIAQYQKEKEKNQYNPKAASDIVEEGIKLLSQPSLTPETLKRAQEFAMEKTAQTFGDVAFDSYKKLGNKMPIISIENPPMGHAFARAEDLKKIVDKSREVFVERAVKAGYSEGEAKSIAKKIIGATWDVGHINMLRKFGYDKVDVVKETKHIAPEVKHVHLSDNFGFEHTELPMGMGNVPVKEHLEALKEKGFKGQEVVEVSAWWKHFGDQGSPLNPSMEAFGSSVFGGPPPYWNQIGYTFGNYFTTLYGDISPDVHHSIYGAGFSTQALPQELGGRVPGTRDRLTGTPTA